LRFVRVMELMQEQDWQAAADELGGIVEEEGVDLHTRSSSWRRLATCLQRLGDYLDADDATRRAARLHGEVLLHPVWGVFIRHDTAVPVDSDPVWGEYDTEGPDPLDPSVQRFALAAA
jgi:hypothetical protein